MVRDAPWSTRHRPAGRTCVPGGRARPHGGAGGRTGAGAWRARRPLRRPGGRAARRAGAGGRATGRIPAPRRRRAARCLAAGRTGCAGGAWRPPDRAAAAGLLGGVLLAQVVLVPAVAQAEPASAPPDRSPAAAASALAGGAAAAGARDHPGLERGGHGPASLGAGAQQPGSPGIPSTSSTMPSPPWVPMPTWLGGSQPSGATVTTGATTTAPRRSSPSASDGQGPDANRGGSAAAAAAEASHPYVIRPGDTLWDVAAAHLPRGSRSPGRIDRYWRRIHAANRGVLGDDPHLIHPGTRLVLPPADAAARGRQRP